jgi:putative phosphotransacetylase
MDIQLLKQTIESVLAELVENGNSIPVEVSGRHVHLGAADAEKLFGAPLTPVRELSQPGQFLCKERVRLIGPRGMLENIAVLGPVRNETQVEVSLTDARELGVNAAVRQSGDTAGTAGIMIASDSACVESKQGVIAAQRHIHMTTADAVKLKVSDKDIVSVRVESERSLVFDQVLVRVSDSFRLAMHIDFDEGNACGWTAGTVGRIVDLEQQKGRQPAPERLQGGFKSVGTSAVTLSKKLVTEKDVIETFRAGITVLRVPVSAIMTPLAVDSAREHRVKIETF